MVERTKGIVRWFSNSLGYGFVAPEGGGNDIFVHFSNVHMKGYKTLRENQTIEFEVGTIEKNGKTMSNALEVTVLGEVSEEIGESEGSVEHEHDEECGHDEEDTEANS